MRCVCCNRPFTPSQSQKGNMVFFSKTCYTCNSNFYKGYANTHEHVLGIDEEPLTMIAKKGSIKTEEY